MQSDSGRDTLLDSLSSWAGMAYIEILKAEEDAAVAEAFNEGIERIKGSQGPRIAFAGRFSSGKTTLVNSVLGRPLLKTGLSETTAVPTAVRRGAAERLLLKSELVWYEANPAERDEFFGLTADSMTPLLKRYIDEQEEVILETPLAPKKLELLDLPGVSSSLEAVEERARKALILADAIVWVVNGKDGILSASDLEYLQEHIPNDTPKLVAVTHMDHIYEGERQQVINAVRGATSQIDNIVGIVGTEPEKGLQAHLEFQRLLKHAAGSSRMVSTLKDVLGQIEEIRKAEVEELAKEFDELLAECRLTKNDFRMYCKGLFKDYRNALSRLNRCVSDEAHFVGYQIDVDRLWDWYEKLAKELGEAFNEKIESIQDDQRTCVVEIMLAVWNYANRAFQSMAYGIYQALSTTGWRFEVDLDNGGDLAGAFKAQFNWNEFFDGFVEEMIEFFDCQYANAKALASEIPSDVAILCESGSDLLSESKLMSVLSPWKK